MIVHMSQEALDNFVMVATIEGNTSKKVGLKVYIAPYQPNILRDLIETVPDKETKKRFTQSSFAERCNETAKEMGLSIKVAQKTISNYCTGATKPDSDMLEVMGKVLRVLFVQDWTGQYDGAMVVKELGEIYQTIRKDLPQ